MSDDSYARGRFSSLAMVLGLAIILALTCVAEGVRAWLEWQHDRQTVPASITADGTLYSATLTNGQVYYGDLVALGPRFVLLDHVYYVQTWTNPVTNQQENRVVNRGKSDWHAPIHTLIPIDKVLMIEKVGHDSRIATLIRQEKAAPSSN